MEMQARAAGWLFGATVVAWADQGPDDKCRFQNKEMESERRRDTLTEEQVEITSKS